VGQTWRELQFQKRRHRRAESPRGKERGSLRGNPEKGGTETPQTNTALPARIAVHRAGERIREKKVYIALCPGRRGKLRHMSSFFDLGSWKKNEQGGKGCGSKKGP